LAAPPTSTAPAPTSWWTRAGPPASGPGSLYIAGLFCTLPFILQRYLGVLPRASGDPRLNAIHVQDVAGAIAHLLGRPELAGQAFNLADDHWQAVGELLDNVITPLGLRTLPLALPLDPMPMDTVATLVEKLPALAFALTNRVLRQQWARIINAHALNPALSPRFDRDFVSYGHGDHVYANDALKATGYQLRWPRFDSGYRETVTWYQQQRWIPAAPTDRRP
jgi:nucleoside-diphosphate-sugar epimerase